MGTDVHPYAEVRRDGKWERVMAKMPDRRNYMSFAYLADVRNGSGFAGCDTGDEVKPIAMPRGLPDDRVTFDNGYEKGVKYDDPEYVWLGDHSHSWLSLEELLTWNPDEGVVKRGFVSPEQADKFAQDGIPPESWYGWTSREDWRQIEWRATAKDYCGLIKDWIEFLKPLGDPKDVRVVFGFDS